MQLMLKSSCATFIYAYDTDILAQLLYICYIISSCAYLLKLSLYARRDINEFNCLCWVQHMDSYEMYFFEENCQLFIWVVSIT